MATTPCDRIIAMQQLQQSSTEATVGHDSTLSAFPVIRISNFAITVALRSGIGALLLF